MGGEAGKAIAQIGMGFMAERGRAQFAQQAQQKMKQDAFAMESAQEMASKGELDMLSGDIQKSLMKSIGKENFGILQQQNQLNGALRQARRGAAQQVQQVQQEVPGQPQELPQGQQGPPAMGEPTTQNRVATDKEAYENFTNLDSTGVYLLTGNVQAGQLAQQANNLELDKKQHFLARQKAAFDMGKPEMTRVFEKQNEDGTISNVIGMIAPDGSISITDLGQASNKDQISRTIDAMATITDKLDDASLTPSQRKTLEKRKSLQEKSLEKQLAADKNGSGLSVIMGKDEEGKPVLLGVTNDEVVARQLVALDGATKGLDKKEIATDRKVIRNGALALKTISRIEEMADPRVFGPGATIGQFTQSLKANIQAMPAVSEYVTSTINGAKTDFNSIPSKELRAKILKDFNSTPEIANQFMLSLIYQLAKLEDPESVVKEGEYDRYKKEIMGGQGITGSFPAMMARLGGLKVRINDRVDAANKNIEGITELINKRLGVGQGGQPTGQPQAQPDATPAEPAASEQAQPAIDPAKTLGSIPEEQLQAAAQSMGVDPTFISQVRQQRPNVTVEQLQNYINQSKKKQ